MAFKVKYADDPEWLAKHEVKIQMWAGFLAGVFAAAATNSLEVLTVSK